jgi:hypothetical protein
LSTSLRDLPALLESIAGDEEGHGHAFGVLQAGREIDHGLVCHHASVFLPRQASA